MSIQDDYYDIKVFISSSGNSDLENAFERFSEFAFQQEQDADALGDQVRAVREFAKILKEILADD